jgi:hypothetical protein
VLLAMLVVLSFRAARRSLRNWSRRVLLYPALLVLLVVAMGGAVGTVMAATSSNPAPTSGHTYIANGHRLYLNCVGSGSPTVVLFSGLGEWTPNWAWVQANVSHRTRVCAFDRAGDPYHALLAASGRNPRQRFWLVYAASALNPVWDALPLVATTGPQRLHRLLSAVATDLVAAQPEDVDPAPADRRNASAPNSSPTPGVWRMAIALATDSRPSNGTPRRSANARASSTPRTVKST